MWMNFARVSAASLEALKKDASGLDFLFFSEDGAKAAANSAGIVGAPCAGLDYRTAAMVIEAMAEHTGEGESDPLGELGVTGDLDYDAGYGPAFYLDPAAVKKASADSGIPPLDDEVEELFAAAAKAGEAIVGVIT